MEEIFVEFNFREKDIRISGKFISKDLRNLILWSIPQIAKIDSIKVNKGKLRREIILPD